LKGNLILSNVKVDGVLMLDSSGHIGDIEVNDKKYQEFVPIDDRDPKYLQEFLKIRAYDLKKFWVLVFFNTNFNDFVCILKMRSLN